MTPEAKKLNSATRNNVIEVVKRLNGHTIFDTNLVRDRFPLPKKVWKPILRTHRSDHESHKSTIFVDSQPVDELMGIYGLSLLWSIADWLGADTKAAASKMGRGFQAAELRAAIIEACGNNEHEVMK